MTNLKTKRPEFEGFEAYYDAEIEPFLLEKEGERAHRISIHDIIMARTLVFVPLIAILIAVFIDDGESFVGIIIFGLGAGVLLAKLFLAQFRSKIMEHIIGKASVFLRWHYDSKSENISVPTEFQTYGLIPKSSIPVKAAHSVGGKIKGADVTLHKITVMEDGRKNQVFSGLIMVLDFHRKFLGQTIVLRNVEGGSQYRKMGLKPVSLVDSKFEEVFDVFSNDQVEARYLLDYTFMQKLLDLEDVIQAVPLMQSPEPSRSGTSFAQTIVKMIKPAFSISKKQNKDLGIFVKDGVTKTSHSAVSYVKALRYKDLQKAMTALLSILRGIYWPTKSKFDALAGRPYSRAAFIDGKFLLAVHAPGFWTADSMKLPLADLARTQDIITEFEFIFDMVDVVHAKPSRPNYMQNLKPSI